MTDTLTEPHDIAELRSLIEAHVAATGSPRGKKILAAFHSYIPCFKKVMPRDYDRMLRSIAQYEEKGMSRQQAEIEASTIVLDDATKLSLMLAEIPTEAKPTMPPKLGYKWVPTYSSTAGFAWELQEDPNAYGTNDHPLYWVDGMTVCTGYYYTDGDKLYAALQDGAAPALTDTEWFEVV